jgi:hypothetical protein
MIDEDMESHGTKNVYAEIPLYAKQCSDVQLRILVGLVLSAPHLGKLPEDTEKFSSIFEVITSNMIEALTEHGYKYYLDNYSTD